jgi:flagellin
MALSIINNIAAIGAQRALSNASLKLGESLARLSSGLRINSAKDDPSGLAISERFRTQIRGLARASLNAQDAISFLQTAEGALNETHSILQRMRELAVQAANGILTTNDRLEIQKEIDQLSEEINRIANSTEFNTKKMLDGSGAALWSADSPDITAVITGLVAEGNYRLEKNNEPTVNHVIKTDIFAVKANAQGVTNLDLGPTAASWTYTVGAAAAGTLDFDFGAGVDAVAYAAGADVAATAANIVAAINADSTANDYVIATDDGGGTFTVTAITAGSAANTYTVAETLVEDNILVLGNVGTTPTTLGIDAPGITAVDNASEIPAGTGYTITVDADVGVAPADSDVTVVREYTQTGSTTSWSAEAGAGGALTTAANNVNGYLILEITDTGGAAAALNSGSVFARVSVDNGITWYAVDAATDLITGQDFQINGVTYDVDLVAASLVQAGDKALFAFNGNSTDNYATLQADAPDQGPGPLVSYNPASLLSSTQTVSVGAMDASGNVTFGTLEVTFGTSIADGSVSFDITASSGIAQGSTQLYFVDRSYDNVGNFIWGDSGQYITIYNAFGDSSSVFIDGADTIQEVADKIENAITGEIVNGGLGMGSGIDDVDDHVADFVTNPTLNTDEAVAGTIVIRSPKQGINGKLSFSGSEDVLKFFSFADTQDPRDEIDPLTVTVFDAHSGELIGGDTVSDNVLRNVISGVEVHIDSNVDVDVAWNATERSFSFASSPGTEIEHLHIVDASVTFQIGANPGQDTRSFIAQMDGVALNTDNVLVINQELAALALQKVDNAINVVSSERARIGGNISRLQHTINNLDVQAENAIAAESRIRDLDMALEMTEFTKQQLLLQASTAMLAQANQVPQILLQLLR